MTVAMGKRYNVISTMSSSLFQKNACFSPFLSFLKCRQKSRKMCDEFIIRHVLYVDGLLMILVFPTGHIPQVTKAGYYTNKIGRIIRNTHHHHHSAVEQSATSFLQRWRSWAISNSWLSFSRLSGSPKRQWISLANKVRCLPGFLLPWIRTLDDG